MTGKPEEERDLGRLCLVVAEAMHEAGLVPDTVIGALPRDRPVDPAPEDTDH